MARRARTRADTRRRYDFQHDMPLIDGVCSRFCNGDSPTQIREYFDKELRRPLSREQPYQILSFAAQHGLLRYEPPTDYQLAKKLKQDPRLEEVEVVQTAEMEPVATRAAQLLVRLLQQMAVNDGAKEVHIGLAGGGTILHTVKAFGALLDGPIENLPNKLVFHAMVTGLQLHDPRTDPNTFFTFLPFGKRGNLTTKFVALHGPALPDKKLIEHLIENHPPTKTTFAEAKHINVVLTSGTSWDDDADSRLNAGDDGPHYHSRLKKLMQDAGGEGRKAVRELKEEKCVADMLWQPISIEKPLPNHPGIQAMTLLELEKLPELTQRGGKVLLVLGPCACGRARDDVLRTVLGWEGRHVTHLVADSRTANV